MRGAKISNWRWRQQLHDCAFTERVCFITNTDVQVLAVERR